MLISSINKAFFPVNNVLSKDNGSPALKLHPLQRDTVSFSSKQNKTEKGNFKEIKGSETTAKIFTNDVDYQTLNQIKTICNHPVFRDSPIRIMPDVHTGNASVVGFSAKLQNGDAFIPGIIGSDIGCGMLCTKIDTNGESLDFEKLDGIIRKYISGKNIEDTKQRRIPAEFMRKLNAMTRKISGGTASFCETNLGTLGGGNHFIEIDKNKNGEHYLVIHSGARSLGQMVGEHYQSLAEEKNPYPIKELSYLTGNDAKEYFEATKLTREYAHLNRKIIADIIIKEMGWKPKKEFESVHNYISEDFTVRKGAISAKPGETLIIPISMKDGAIIAKGKGNDDWNNTAPHGAGRKFSRGDAKKKIDFQEYKSSMSGIYSTCVTTKTLSESPQAYRSVHEIGDVIGDTAEIQEFIEPIYNFKG